MTVPQQLEAYLEVCRRRLRRTMALRLAAGGLVGVLAVTAAFAAAAVTLVPSQGWVIASRVLVYGLLALTAVVAWRWPSGRRAAARRIESRVTAFDGRLATWADASRRRPQPEILPLLAKESIALAHAHPPAAAVPSKLLAVPVATAFAAVAALVWLLVGAPTGWQLSAQRLWAASLLEDTMPRVVVEPGNVVVPRGADVVVRARAQGFFADEMHVHAAFASGGRWERAGMAPGAQGGHEFVLVSVTETVEYYVSAQGLNSERYSIEVADLPGIESITLNLSYPAWTRLAARRQDSGDVAAVPGTRVGVDVTTDLPMSEGHLVVDTQAHALAGADNRGVGDFEVTKTGTWHIAVMHQGRLVKISDEFLIEVTQDAAPEVEFAFPGHDRSATSIEEVALRFRALDDFGIEGFALNYSVNGGAWQRHDLLRESADSTDITSGHLLSFEDLEPQPPRGLRPGDVVSFFVEAVDHRQTTRSALYFVDVRPFGKRYREMQSSGGDGGGGNGLDIAARQRDIVSATWNLVRERDTNKRQGQDLSDQADVVAMLQRMLKDQVETLIQRSQRRGLSANAEVDVFVTELASAVEFMEPAAEHLSQLELDEAVTPEQRALQHLLTAEASLRDINVSMSLNDSMGGSLDRSLSELIDLEMDPERNRYEVPQTPNFGQSQPEDDSDWRRLEELARKQEELARQGDAQETPMSRWQQERLKRELEALRERLAAGGQSRQRSGRIDEAIERLDSARDAIDESLDRDRSDRQTYRRAGEALRQAAQSIREDGRDQLTGRLQQAERDISRLVEDQRRIMERLEALQQRVLDASRNGEEIGYRNFELWADAQTKRRMQRDLAEITRDLADAQQGLAQADPGMERLLERALDDLMDNRISERMTVAADAFESGRPLFMVGHEGLVEDALARFRSRIGRIAERLAGAAAMDRQEPTVAGVQALRRDLEQAAARQDASALDRIARAVGAIEASLNGPAGELDLSADRARYRALGASDENTERLYQLTLEQLDRMEIALIKVDGGTVRAQDPRDDAYDSDAVARYFRRLSCGAAETCD